MDTRRARGCIMNQAQLGKLRARVSIFPFFAGAKTYLFAMYVISFI